MPKNSLKKALFPFSSFPIILFVAMRRRMRQALCALKEQSSIKYAKIATFGGFCDIDFIIIKATSPDDLPLPERYIHELLKIFSISSSSFHTFVLCFTRRFGNTHCWKVALKCLLLLHRLLRSLPECSPFRAELLSAKSNGLISLYPCKFRDDSSSNPEDYTSFIRSYAQLLDEGATCFFTDKEVYYEEFYEEEEEHEEEMAETLQEKFNKVYRMVEILPQLQSLIDRVMDCRPTGVAAKSFIVQSAMKYIIRDSFLCYSTFRKEIILVLDNLIRLPYRNSISSFGIYKKAALQAEQLCEFYDWCKEKGLCGSYEYPYIEKIPEIQIRALESFLNGMWQLTESSLSSATSPSSWIESNKSTSSTEGDEKDKQLVIVENNSNKGVKFDENISGEFPRKSEGNVGMMEPLIQLEEDEENGNWEVLLDASLNLSCLPSNNLLIDCPGFSNIYQDLYGKENYEKDSNGDKTNQWQIQVYNPNALNPFLQPSCYGQNWSKWPASNPEYPWGL